MGGGGGSRPVASLRLPALVSVLEQRRECQEGGRRRRLDLRHNAEECMSMPSSSVHAPPSCALGAPAARTPKDGRRTGDSAKGSGNLPGAASLPGRCPAFAASFAAPASTARFVAVLASDAPLGAAFGACPSRLADSISGCDDPETMSFARQSEQQSAQAKAWPMLGTYM